MVLANWNGFTTPLLGERLPLGGEGAVVDTTHSSPDDARLLGECFSHLRQAECVGWVAAFDDSEHFSDEMLRMVALMQSLNIPIDC